MVLRKLENGEIYANDVEFSAIARCAIISLTITLICFLFIRVLAHAVFEENYTDDCTHNQTAKIVNQLPLDQREYLVNQLGIKLDNETHLVSITEPKPVEASQANFNRLFWPIMLCSLLLAPSIYSALYYYSHQDAGYFFVDLPCRGIRGCILLVILWTTWPAMLVSYYRLRKCRQEQEQIQEARKQAPERAKVMARKQLQLSDDELTKLSEEEIDAKLEKVIQAQIPHDFTESGCITYRKARHNFNQENRSARIQTIEEEITIFEEEIKSYAAEIQNNQKKIGAEQAALRELRNKPESTSLDDQQIAREWQELQTMRGVYKFSVEHNSNWMIYVRVRLPYKGIIYDLGDFRIEITKNNGDDYHSLQAFEIRSGKDPEATNAYPVYRIYDDKFCFGSSAEREIDDYLCENDLTAAVALAIDRLHFVNEENRHDIPHCFQPIQTLEEIGEPK